MQSAFVECYRCNRTLTAPPLHREYDIFCRLLIRKNYYNLELGINDRYTAKIIHRMNIQVHKDCVFLNTIPKIKPATRTNPTKSRGDQLTLRKPIRDMCQSKQHRLY